MAIWKLYIQESYLPISDHCNITNYLSCLEDRVKSEAQNLPTDEHFIENALLLQQCFTRKSLIIDPLNVAMRFLQQLFEDHNLA